MDNSLKGLLIAVGVIITCVVISLGFYISKIAADTGNEAVGEIANLKTSLDTAKLASYDKTTLTGAQVLNAVTELTPKGLGIGISTNKSNDKFTWYNKTVSSDGIIDSEDNKNNINELTDLSKDEYINTAASFSSELIRDANGTTVAVTFKQSSK